MQIKNVLLKIIRWLYLIFGLGISLFLVVSALANQGSTQEPLSMEPNERNPTATIPSSISATSTLASDQHIDTFDEPKTATPAYTPTPPAWEGFPGPMATAITEIPPPMRGVELPAEVSVTVLLGSDAESPLVGRTDTIILVFYNPRLAKASLLSIPRDLLVYIPGHNMDRINQAYLRGGMDLVSLTLEYNFNIVPDNWLLIHLNDFVAFVDDLGGIEISIPENAPYSSSFPPGDYHFRGPAALWFIRERDQSSDIDRNRRQHEMIRALTRAILRGGNLVKLPMWYARYSNSVVTNFTLIDLLSYVPLALQFGDQSRVQYAQINWNNVDSWRTSGGAAVLLPKPDHVQHLLQNAIAFVSNPAPFSDLAQTLAAELTASPTPTMTPSPTSTPTPTATKTPTLTLTATPDLTQTTKPTDIPHPTSTKTPSGTPSGESNTPTIQADP